MTMSRERAVEAWAGFLILLSVALAHFIHYGFILFTAFVGFMLFQQAFTGFCPATIILKKLGVKSERELAAQSQ